MTDSATLIADLPHIPLSADDATVAKFYRAYWAKHGEAVKEALVERSFQPDADLLQEAANRVIAAEGVYNDALKACTSLGLSVEWGHAVDDTVNVRRIYVPERVLIG